MPAMLRISGRIMVAWIAIAMLTVLGIMRCLRPGGRVRRLTIVGLRRLLVIIWVVFWVHMLARIVLLFPTRLVLRCTGLLPPIRRLVKWTVRPCHSMFLMPRIRRPADRESSAFRAARAHPILPTLRI